MLGRTFLFLSLLSLSVASGCGGGTTTTGDSGAHVDAAMAFDAGTTDDAATGVDSGLANDAGAVDAASAVDSGPAHDAGATDAARPDSGPLSCGALPPCAEAKGCGPTLTTACCCGDSVFDPATAIGCCCGYGIVPGAMLTCEG
jgi:hypothetical protein